MTTHFLVTGSRDYPHPDLVGQVLYSMIRQAQIGSNHVNQMGDLYVGDARGVDRHAARVFKELTGRQAVIFRADWLANPRSAGIIRTSTKS